MAEGAEKHGILVWKRPLRPLSPTIHPTPPCLLNHVPKGHIHMVFEPLQGWGLHHCPGQPGPRPDHSLSEDIFPNLQAEPPLTQPEAIASHHRVMGWKRPLRSSSPTANPTPPCLLNHVPKGHIHTLFKHLQGWGLHHLPSQPIPTPDQNGPIAGSWGAEPNPPSLHPPVGAVESEKVSPQPPLLQTEQPQLPQPLLMGLVLQAPPQPRCPSLDTLQPLNVLLLVRGPKAELSTRGAASPVPSPGDPQPPPHTAPSPASVLSISTVQTPSSHGRVLGVLEAHR